MKIGVIGAGSFGTALAEVAMRCGHEVLIWAHDPKVAVAIRESRSNPVYLPTAKFNDAVSATNSLADVASFSDTLLSAVPSHHHRSVFRQFAAELGDRRVRVVSGTKGIENESLERVSEMTKEVLGDRLAAFGTVSGPTFAAEMSREDPTTAVIASDDDDFAAEMQTQLSCRTFRMYRSNDVVGVELSGALKNVIAIAAGVVEGVGFGSNTTAALITRGLHEIRRLGMALGGKPETFAGLAGMGDLVLTCTGSLSRNRAVGVELGQGKTLNEILNETRRIAEGVKTCKAAKQLADRHGIEMPIIGEMHRVLYENEKPRDAIARLMTRTLKAEVERAQLAADATHPGTVSPLATQ